MIGGHFIKGCARTQNHVTLSSAEAELIALVKCSAEVLGVRDLPRGSIVWRVPDVRARPDLDGIIRRDQVLAHGEVADVHAAGTQCRLSPVVQTTDRLSILQEIAACSTELSDS